MRVFKTHKVKVFLSKEDLMDAIDFYLEANNMFFSGKPTIEYRPENGIEFLLKVEFDLNEEDE